MEDRRTQERKKQFPRPGLGSQQLFLKQQEETGWRRRGPGAANEDQSMFLELQCPLHPAQGKLSPTSPLAGTSPYLINALDVCLMYDFCLSILYNIVLTNYVSSSYFPEQSQVPDEGLSQLSSVPQSHGQPRTQSLTHTHKPTCWYKSLFD